MPNTGPKIASPYPVNGYRLVERAIGGGVTQVELRYYDGTKIDGYEAGDLGQPIIAIQRRNDNKDVLTKGLHAHGPHATGPDGKIEEV